MAGPTHLARRFFTSLRPRPPSAADLAWVQDVLEPGEWDVWCRLVTADRVEAIATARRLPPEYAGDERWLAAALVHDVGKADAHLGPFGRAAATVVGWRRDPALVRGRFGIYLRHPDIGAAALDAAGARPEATAWAALHHRPERFADCAIPPEVCEALARADGE
ncbi:MAG: hypothetical protein SGJ13_06140 [Actinomycetota bacterium]|nr:hypothetical protein [Actinomycetota bacterium]